MKKKSCDVCCGNGWYIHKKKMEVTKCHGCNGRGFRNILDTNSSKFPRLICATGTESRVCADIAARQAKGVAKYGTTVEANPLPLREWLQHAYEETLDKAVYLKRAIEEIDKEPFQRFFDAAEKTDTYKQERQALRDAREFDKEPD